jgi:hypothetical protein
LNIGSKIFATGRVAELITLSNILKKTLKGYFYKKHKKESKKLTRLSAVSRSNLLPFATSFL